jgi:hypothetical protein
VDAANKEAHLSNQEFESVFELTRVKFATLPKWKRNALKKKVGLF